MARQSHHVYFYISTENGGGNKDDSTMVVLFDISFEIQGVFVHHYLIIM
jgi:hypothetical protein